MNTHLRVTPPQTATPPEGESARPTRPRARARSRGLRASALAAALAFLHAAAPAPACARSLMDNEHTDGPAQGSAAAREKRSRTPAQRKIDSQLLYAIYRKRGQAKAKGVPAGEPAVRYDDEGRALVNIRARPVGKVVEKVKSLGGVVISYLERYDDINAAVPLEKLEALAALKEVRAIMPAAEATTNGAVSQ